MHFWNYIKYQKCIKNLWNYIESASKWCSFKSASKVHHVFQSFADFSKNMLKCSKTWCTFDALMMHFWNYIKSASKPFETKSKVQNYVVSKAHQKCIKSASSFLDISTCIFFLKWVHAQVVKSFLRTGALMLLRLIIPQVQQVCTGKLSIQQVCKCRHKYLKYAQVRHKYIVQLCTCSCPTFQVSTGRHK